ncbi:MAG: MBL fold metallo-hydrolase [Lysobacteraceae bacterium]
MLLLLPILLPTFDPPPPGQLDVQVLDVGQGLSVVLQTRHHTLLYDAGPAPPGALDRGEAVVVPALRQRGIARLDRLIISHGDNDHAGGAAAVIRAMRPADVLAGEPEKLPDAVHCNGGSRWRWDGVDFRLLHPPLHFPELGNESSCVLLVEAGGQRLLLPGDIDALIELRLLREHPDLAGVDVLLMPHHGSGSSSSAAFVDALRPQLALASAGHRNRFGHPRADVVQRYVEAGSRVHGTAGEGAISLRLGAGTEMPELLAEREQQRHFWSEDTNHLH